MNFFIYSLTILIIFNFSSYCKYQQSDYQNASLRHRKSNWLGKRYPLILGYPNLTEEIEVRNSYLGKDRDAKKIKWIKKKKDALRSGLDKHKMADTSLLRSNDVEDSRGYHKDPVMNFWTRRKKSRDSEDTDYVSSSSSLELYHWKDEWKNVWLKKKLEALNSSVPSGDMVNMVAARPWGVPCGDPNKHDMPWGTCMLPMECEGEYRIYRGDLSCGRTQFVCCALQVNNYDMYEGFDISFDETSLETDTEEKKWREMTSKERRSKKRRKERRKRKRDRQKRKRKIKKNIKNIVKEIKKILNRSYKNGTNIRKRKTKQLKRFIKELKKQYRKDRQSVKDIHEIEMIKIDAALMKKLNEIKVLNRNFIRNSTFREIILNGTMNKKQARMLMEAYPELESYLLTRRTGDSPPREDDYDVEYSYLEY